MSSLGRRILPKHSIREDQSWQFGPGRVQYRCSSRTIEQQQLLEMQWTGPCPLGAWFAVTRTACRWGKLSGTQSCILLLHAAKSREALERTSRGLARPGMASLLIELRGVGEGTCFLGDARFSLPSACMKVQRCLSFFKCEMEFWMRYSTSKRVYQVYIHWQTEHGSPRNNMLYVGTPLPLCAGSGHQKLQIPCGTNETGHQNKTSIQT